MSTSIDAITASQLALAGSRAVESSIYDIMIQESIRRQQEIVNNIIQQNIAATTLRSASELFLQQETIRQYEMMKLINPPSSWIDSLTFAKTIPVEPKIDEEITIKKSEWNNLQDRIEKLEEEIKTLKIEQSSEMDVLKTELNVARKYMEKFQIIETLADPLKEVLKKHGVSFDI